MLRVLKAFFPALLLTYLLASLLATHSAMQSLRELGVAVPLAVQLQASWHDLLGMASSYLLLILVAFVIALPAAAGFFRLLGRMRPLLFLLAGFMAILAMHLLLSGILNVTPVAAARSLPGLLGQCLAGALGALAYCQLSRRPAI